MKIEDCHLVVTDVGPEGRSRVARHDRVPTVSAHGATVAPLWISPEGTPFAEIPPPGGLSWILMEMKPDSAGGGNGLPNQFHTGTTTNYTVILSGRAILHVQDGEVEVRPGDTVVHRPLGAPHRWSVPGPENCLMASMMSSPAECGS